jgi:hypothetical protein
MVRSDEVDIISICVKVPEHRDILLAALAAGKHIYCEWPLGRNIQEAEELATTAERAGVHVTIGCRHASVPPRVGRGNWCKTEPLVDHCRRESSLLRRYRCGTAERLRLPQRPSIRRDPVHSPPTWG